MSRTQAELLKRQQEILVDREVSNMTWAAIGSKHSMGEKEARETYRRYIREIAPLIVDQEPEETVLEYIRTLQAARQSLYEVVADADNDSARIGGLREIVKTILKEVELLQHAGLMPTNLADARVRDQHERRLGRMEEVLRRHSAAPAVYEELAAALYGESER